MPKIFHLLMLLLAVFAAQCTSSGGGKGALSNAANTAEIISLKMAAAGKKPDGTPLKKEDPGYIEPEEASRRLADMLSLGNSRPRTPLTKGDGKAGPELPPYALPPVLDFANSAPVSITVTDASGRPADFLLRINASGINVLSGASVLGEYHRGSYSGWVPAGPVRVEIRGGLFRMPVVRETIVKPGKSLRIRTRLEKGLLPLLVSQHYTPFRLLYRLGRERSTPHVANPDGELKRESSRSAEFAAGLLDNVEAVWQTGIIAAGCDNGSGSQGRLSGALVPPWPGYGRNLIVGDTNLTDLLGDWRRSRGSMPGGAFLADPSVLWAAVLLPPENGRLISPKNAFLFWRGLVERFATVGVFEELLPAEFPALYMTGFVRAVCVPPTRQGLDMFASLNRLYPEVLPAPSPPRPHEAFPDLLIWGSPASAVEAIELLRKGSYTISRGLYIMADLDGNPPSVTDVLPLGTPHSFRVTVMTGKLTDAAIDEVLIYRNGEVVHRESGQPNETRMQIAFSVNDEVPARYWIAALGHAAEPPGTQPFEGADLPNKRCELFAMTASFRVGGEPATAPEEINITIQVKDLRGQLLRGARITGSQAVSTDEHGKTEVRWRRGMNIAVEHSGESAPVEPLLAPQLFRLYETVHSGAINWASKEYRNRIYSILNRHTLEIMLPVSSAPDAGAPPKTP